MKKKMWKMEFLWTVSTGGREQKKKKLKTACCAWIVKTVKIKNDFELQLEPELEL